MTVTLRPHQVVAIEDADRLFNAGATTVCSVLPTGAGKCHGVDTPIMMFDGSIKMVQDVVAGDLLMGPDSKPREVLSLARGEEMLYRVKPVKGDSYVVNESHILSLKQTGLKSKPKYKCQTGKGEIVNVSVKDYLNKSKNFKHSHKGWRTGVEFEHKDLPFNLPPYLLGVWLGDGHSNGVSITSADKEIHDYITEFAELTNQDVRIQNQVNNASTIHHVTNKRSRTVGTKFELKQLDLLNNKHIPDVYKINSRENRLQLLAGILDSDGHLSKGYYDVVFKNEQLANDTVFLARSLGFAAYIKPCKKKCCNTGVTGDYFRFSVSGDVNEIPTKLSRHQPGKRKQIKNVLVTGINLEPIGIGKYYGFTITGDHLYLLGDFTVTHNTIIKGHYAKRAFDAGETCLLIAHRDVLLEQISDAVCLYGVPHSFICSDATRRDITNLNYSKFGDSYYDERSNIIIVSVDTFMARVRKGTIPEYLLESVKWWLMDETHHLTQGSKWGNLIDALPNARGLGVTATPIRGDKKGLGRQADGYFDKLSVTTNMFDLIKAGRLTPYKIFATSELDVSGINVTAGGDYNSKQLSQRTRESGITGSAVEHYIQHIYGQPAITFCVDIEHAKSVADEFNKAGIPSACVSSKSKPSERKKAVEDLRNGTLWNLVNVDLFGEGFDAPAVTAVFFLRKTESYSLFKQQMGRCLRPAEGKTYGYIFDHVGNVNYMCQRFGLTTPHDDPVWTLERRGSKKNDEWIECEHCMHIGPSETKGDLIGFKQPNGLLVCPECGEGVSKHKEIERMNCEECGYQGPVNDVFDKDGDLILPGFTQPDGSLVCPDEECGHVHTFEEQETVKSKLQVKKGVLKELTIDAIEAIMAERDRVDMPMDKFANTVGNSSFAHAAMNKHVNRMNAQTVLRNKIQTWCNQQFINNGWSIKIIQNEFEIKFGENIFVAQTLSANKANALTEKIQDDLRSSSAA